MVNSANADSETANPSEVLPQEGNPQERNSQEPQETLSQEATPQETLSQETQPHGDGNIPISALQRERKKKQEAELRAIKAEERAKLLEEGLLERGQAHEDLNDNDDEEFITRGDYKKREAETVAMIVRQSEEKSWIKNNPDKMEIIEEKFEEFLKQKPHFVSSLEKSNNRYEDAWHLLSSYYRVSDSKKQNATRMNTQRADMPQNMAPQSPAGIPKSAGIDQAVNVMKMTDKEYDAWVGTKKRRR